MKGNLKLYPHQKDAVDAIESQFASGSQKTLAVLATGTGKTIIYLHLVAKWAREGKRVLILAHRRELIHQPVDRAEDFFPDLAPKMGIVMADKDEDDAQVVVATVQTVYRDRLTDAEFDYVILDEAHHGTADTYLSMVERFEGAKWLGMTATPFRTDGNSLAKVFDSVAYRFPITAAIDQGMLVPFDAYGFTLPLSIDGVTETVNGWAEEALGDLLSAGNALEIVYEKWAEFCSDRQTICFTSSVAQAHATAKYFRSRGVAAEAVDGSTAKGERDRILEDFRNGVTQVVCNCQVWTEGVDVPEASAALMVCPTKSDLVYVQKLGRILRIYEGKTDAVVLDFAPIEDRNIVMAGDILGIPRVEKTEKEKAENAGMLIGASRVDDRGLTVSVDPAVVIVEALRFLRKGRLAWSLKDYMSVASLSDAAMIAIELPNVARLAKAEEMRSNGSWSDAKERLYESLKSHRIWLCRKEGRGWSAQFIGQFDTMDEAMATSEILTDAEFMPKLAKKSVRWRKKAASAAQFKYMRYLGIKPPDLCTQGQAAQLISHELAAKAVRKARPNIEQRIIQGDLP